MIHGIQELAEHDVSWLAIRHPAVMRLLDRELAAPDGDAFAAGLELATRVLGGWISSSLPADHIPRVPRSARPKPQAAWPEVPGFVRSSLGGRAPLGDLRLDHNTLNTGMVAVRSGRCDRAMVRSIRDQIEELSVVLTPREQDAVATVIAAIIWSVLDASSRELDDLLVS
jgi:hypothetical protein